ncbi:N-acetylmuramoyl-L-alanine amidase [Selenomonas sp. GACV-9]|uniref:N-acetylmuramoyl-L-alanine amidase n=1 Tax=Selenomonas sp. GACV-9 TaxID=3158782 RepID=UPI0008E5E017|nr:N-acetylmuramoyl-L-alanine amidase [Selenomonas ruminantium]
MGISYAAQAAEKTAIEAKTGQLAIQDRPVLWTAKREQLIREYAKKHYGREMVTIVPQAVVVHWTASHSAESTYKWFYKEDYADGTLNVGSQFLVDRDGTIYRLASETALCRHIIGYNWCAIGIENVGGVNNAEDLTEEQLLANIKLIRYLQAKYPTIHHVFGHYQQDIARKSGLYREKVAGYRSIKQDPGPAFMKGLAMALADEKLVLYGE